MKIMKSLSKPLPHSTPKLLTLAVGLAACTGLAATGPLADPSSAGVTSSSAPWELIIPVLVPVVIAAIKWLLPKVPAVALPIVAPVLGAGLEIVLHFAGLADGNSVTGLILGAAGVGLREVLDQVKKSQRVNESVIQ